MRGGERNRRPRDCVITKTNGFACTGLRGVRVMPMLFWLPMIFMSAMVELIVPAFPGAPKPAPLPLKPERSRLSRD